MLLLFDLIPERLQKQRARDGYGSACSGEAPRTGKERKKRLPDRLDVIVPKMPNNHADVTDLPGEL
jgi:hypothetical protein